MVSIIVVWTESLFLLHTYIQTEYDLIKLHLPTFRKYIISVSEQVHVFHKEDVSVSDILVLFRKLFVLFPYKIGLTLINHWYSTTLTINISRKGLDSAYLAVSLIVYEIQLLTPEFTTMGSAKYVIVKPVYYSSDTISMSEVYLVH